MQKSWGVQLLLLSLLLTNPAAASAQGATFEPSVAQPTGLKAPNKEAVAAYNDGVAFMQQNKSVEAADKFRQAVQFSPDFVNAHCNLGTALVMQGDAQAAVTELQKALALNPKLAAAWATLGSSYQALGQTKQAIEALNKYVELEPKGALAPKVRALIASLKSELTRSGGTDDTKADSYLREATAGGLARWASMPVRVYIKPATEVSGYRSEYADLLKQAFADWEQASEGKVKIEFVEDPAKAQLTCSWTNTTKDAVSAAEGGHTVVIPDAKGNILNANVSLLTVPVTGTEINSNYALRVDLHEIGHAFGILGHSTNPADLMFPSVLPGDKPVSLTSRDVKTLVDLYGDEATKFAKRGLDPSKLVSGDPSSRLNRVLALNNEAKVFIDKGNFTAAIEKLETAHKMEPNNEVVCTNLGSAYGNMAAMAMMVRNFTSADTYFKKAIPLLQHGTNQMNLGLVLKNYSKMLHITNRAPEAAKIDAQLQVLGAN